MRSVSIIGILFAFWFASADVSLEESAVGQACLQDNSGESVCLAIPATFNITYEQYQSEYAITASETGGPIRASCLNSFGGLIQFRVFKNCVFTEWRYFYLCQNGTPILQTFYQDYVTWNTFPAEIYAMILGGCGTLLIETPQISDYPARSFCETAAQLEPNKVFSLNANDVVFETGFFPCGNRTEPHGEPEVLLRAGSWYQIVGTGDIIALRSDEYLHDNHPVFDLCVVFVPDCSCLHSSATYASCAEGMYATDVTWKTEENEIYTIYITGLYDGNIAEGSGFYEDYEVFVDVGACPEEISNFKSLFPCNVPIKCQYNDTLSPACDVSDHLTEYSCDQRSFSAKCIHQDVCLDFPQWVDNNGNDCGWYEEYNFCTGSETFAVFGVGAAEACCFCNGGYFEMLPCDELSAGILSAVCVLSTLLSAISRYKQKYKRVIYFTFILALIDYGLIVVSSRSDKSYAIDFLIVVAFGVLWNIACIGLLTKLEWKASPQFRTRVKTKALHIGILAVLTPKLDCFIIIVQGLSVPYSQNTEKYFRYLSNVQYIIDVGKLSAFIILLAPVYELQALFCNALLIICSALYFLSTVLYIRRTIKKCRKKEIVHTSDAMRTAVTTGDFKQLNKLIDSKADINLKYDDGTSLLTKAGYVGHPKVMKILIEKKADLNAEDGGSKMTGLMVAVQNCYTDVVEMMLLSENPPPIDVENWKGKSALNYATMPTIREYLERELVLSKILFVSGEKLSDIEYIGEGNFSNAYIATMEFDAGLETFTTKIFCKSPKTIAGSDEIHEIRVLHSVPYHPNLLPLTALCLDFPEGDSHFASVMPLKEGGAVKDLVNNWKEPPTHKRLANFAFDIAKGILHLHKHGYIHRDIKLDNCLLQRAACDVNQEVFNKQRVIVADFGLSRPIKSKIGKDEKLFWIRLPLEYFSEKIAYKKTDVYMMGLAFWELHQMIEPFSGVFHYEQLVDFLYAHRFSGIPFKFPDHCSTFFRDLIPRSCAIDPAQRLSDVDVVHILTKHVNEGLNRDDAEDFIMLPSEAKVSENPNDTIVIPGLKKHDGYIGFYDVDLKDNYKDMPQSQKAPQDSQYEKYSHDSSDYIYLAPGKSVEKINPTTDTRHKSDDVSLRTSDLQTTFSPDVGGYNQMAPGNNDSVVQQAYGGFAPGNAAKDVLLDDVTTDRAIGWGGLKTLGRQVSVSDDCYIELTSGDS